MRRMQKATTNAEFQAILEERRAARMSTIDSLPPDVRACVHDYGWSVVNSFINLGITFSPTRGASSSQGQRRAPGIPENHPLNQR